MSLYGNLYTSLYRFYESTLRGRSTFDHYDSLQKSQWYSRDQLSEIQFGELKKLLRHAYDQVPFYRRMFEERDLAPDDIKSMSDYKRLPVIDKDDIRTHKHDMVARDHSGRTIPKATGGSTGQPLKFEYTHASYEWRVAVRMRGYEWARCRDGEKVGYIWGAPIGTPPLAQRVKEGLHHLLLRQKYFNSFLFDEETIDQVSMKLRRFAPEVVVGYTTPLYNFAVSLRDRGIAAPRLRSAITAAEKVQDYQREVIEEVFGCEVFNTYGSREFMLIASECEAHSGLHVHAENIVAEIVHDDDLLSPGAGKAGELVITDLHNYGMPFIRYKIGDLGIPSDVKNCPCGRGLPLIEDVEGRLLDMILTRDGRMVPGEFFPHLAKEFPEIKQFEVVQEELDSLSIRIVQARKFAGGSLERFKAEVEKVVGDNIRLDIEFVDHIPVTATGKSRVTISHVLSKDRSKQ
jgi:phenylacetate-CoA ligase